LQEDVASYLRLKLKKITGCTALKGIKKGDLTSALLKTTACSVGLLFCAFLSEKLACDGNNCCNHMKIKAECFAVNHVHV